MEHSVYKAVMKAMQVAEEMGGVEDADEYVTLMYAIAAEARRRAHVCEETHGRVGFAG